MQEIELPDGTVLEFPDGMGDQEMKAAISREYPQYFTQGTEPEKTKSQRAIAAENELRRRGLSIESMNATTPKVDMSNPMSVASFNPSQVLPGGGSYEDPGAKTMQDIGSIIPAIESGAEAVTSTYGVPVSGLVGLLATPFGIETANDIMERVQKALIYRPQTEGGYELSKTIAYPTEKLNEIAEYAAKPILEAGYPDLAATVKTAIVGAPAVLGGYKAIKSGKAPIEAETKKIIRRGVEKAVRPSVAGKKTRAQIKDYYNKAAAAVEEIVSNKDNLNLVDEYGSKVDGLPNTLDQFSQAIEKTKHDIFKEYDSLAKQANDSGVTVNLTETAKKLEDISNNKILKDLSPETIEYAQKRADVLKGSRVYTAVETQEAIQFLNQTLEKFYRDPGPAQKGQALVDSLIANDLRKQLDNAIERSTGSEYQALKSKYGALKTIEKEVNHRAIVDARKNNKGLLDFSDVFTGGQVIGGMLRTDPATSIVGAAGKGIASYYKLLNDPNKIVKTMFKDVEKQMAKKERTGGGSAMPAAIGSEISIQSAPDVVGDSKGGDEK